MAGLTQYDQLETRCRLLGQEIPFYYCRTQGEDRLCRHILHCWFERLPVETFLHAHYPPEKLDALWSLPRPKMLSLLEEIEKARQERPPERKA
ncbi:hypothetical protein JW933_02935 [candidate division FCPU426 bacterium]|nr:hypothetical protein [candidate division FCPU426 bacterium]